MAPGTQKQPWQKGALTHQVPRAGKELCGSSKREAGGVCLGANRLGCDLGGHQSEEYKHHGALEVTLGDRDPQISREKSIAVQLNLR